MLSDGTWSYTWQHGRQLASMTSGSTTVSFEYDASGMRTEKTVGNKTWQYVYNGSTLSYMTDGTNKLYFSYDSNGAMSVNYNGTMYYYVQNAQGDVIAITNSSGSVVVTYEYDPWGKLIYTGGSMASTLGQMNPLRYRGYVYDIETGLYYLQSRYYNPEMCRFICADGVVSTGQGILGYNMFAYCLNNPVYYSDPSGYASYTDEFIAMLRALVDEELADDLDYDISDVIKQLNLASQGLERSNSSEEATFAALDTYGEAYYKNVRVYRLDNGYNGAFYGAIFLGDSWEFNDDGIRTLNHEYGHYLQFMAGGGYTSFGYMNYTFAVAIPSLICNGLHRLGVMSTNTYYKMPWEYFADFFGGVDR